jgi:hypothetical protein
MGAVGFSFLLNVSVITSYCARGHNPAAEKYGSLDGKSVLLQLWSGSCASFPVVAP